MNFDTLKCNNNVDKCSYVITEVYDDDNIVIMRVARSL